MGNGRNGGGNTLRHVVNQLGTVKEMMGVKDLMSTGLREKQVVLTDEFQKFTTGQKGTLTGMIIPPGEITRSMMRRPLADIVMGEVVFLHGRQRITVCVPINNMDFPSAEEPSKPNSSNPKERHIKRHPGIHNCGRQRGR